MNVAAVPRGSVASARSWRSVITIDLATASRSAPSTTRWAILRFEFRITSGANFVADWSTTTTPWP